MGLDLNFAYEKKCYKAQTKENSFKCSNFKYANFTDIYKTHQTAQIL